VKNKKFLTKKDKQDWFNFIKNPGNIYNKDLSFSGQEEYKDLTRKIDLHGSSLDEANIKITKFINNSFEYGFKKLIIITGKGSRSKIHKDPYRSERTSILKYSVPEYIKNNKSLFNKINRIVKAEIKDGGDGAFYVFLKNNKKIKE